MGQILLKQLVFKKLPHEQTLYFPKLPESPSSSLPRVSVYVSSYAFLPSPSVLLSSQKLSGHPQDHYYSLICSHNIILKQIK